MTGRGISRGEAQDLAELALTVARAAGELLLAGIDDVRAVSTKSSPHDIVTQMDTESERLIRARLTARRPQDAILGEEQGGDDAVPESGVRWVVDPLDGTVNFLYGQPSWAVSIAAEHLGVPVAGVVVAPALGEEYLAVRGGGAWTVGTDRVSLRVSSVGNLADALVSTGFGYLPQRRRAQAAVVADLLPRVRDIRRVGAAALDLCWVARGRLDAHYERGLQPWDRAAGGLVAAEAGAVVGGLCGAQASADMCVAANPALFAELATELQRLGADSGP